MSRLVRFSVSTVAILFLIEVAAPPPARGDNDPRDYEALVALPSQTTVLLGYFRHFSSNDTENLVENLAIFRGVYTLKFGNLSVVPVDLVLPVADVTVTIPTGATSSLSLGGSGIGDLVFLPTILYNLPEDKLVYTYFGFTPYFTLPTGNYDKTKPINIGGNRTSVMPEIAVGQRYKMFNLELIGNATFYTDSSDHLNPMTGGSFTMSQDTSYGFYVHASADVSPTVFLAVSYLLFDNGATHVSGISSDLTPAQQEHTLRFTWAWRLEKSSLLLLQYQQDFHVTGGASLTRWFGARISTFF